VGPPGALRSQRVAAQLPRIGVQRLGGGHARPWLLGGRAPRRAVGDPLALARIGPGGRLVRAPQGRPSRAARRRGARTLRRAAGLADRHDLRRRGPRCVARLLVRAGLRQRRRVHRRLARPARRRGAATPRGVAARPRHDLAGAQGPAAHLPAQLGQTTSATRTASPTSRSRPARACRPSTPSWTR
jgi:hypothetical protein